MRAHHRAFAHDQCQCRSARQHCRHQDRPPPHATFQYRKAEALALGRAWHNRDKLSQSLTAVILAAGLGTRMRSRIPKVLHPLCGRPMLAYVLDAWASAAVSDDESRRSRGRAASSNAAVVVISSATDGVRDILDGEVRYAVQANPKGGTGDAVRVALEQVPDGAAEIVVLSGDVPLVTGSQLAAVLEQRR